MHNEKFNAELSNESNHPYTFHWLDTTLLMASWNFWHGTTYGEQISKECARVVDCADIFLGGNWNARECFFCQKYGARLIGEGGVGGGGSKAFWAMPIHMDHISKRGFLQSKSWKMVSGEQLGLQLQPNLGAWQQAIILLIHHMKYITYTIYHII